MTFILKFYKYLVGDNIFASELYFDYVLINDVEKRPSLVVNFSGFLFNQSRKHAIADTSILHSNLEVRVVVYNLQRGLTLMALTYFIHQHIYLR